MTGKGEAPAVAQGLAPRVVGHQSTATGKKRSPRIQIWVSEGGSLAFLGSQGS